VLFIIVVFN